MSSIASPAGGESHRPITITEILRYPSGTTLHFILLTALLLLSAAFVGNWMYLAIVPGAPISATALWPWLFLPPLAALSFAVAIALVMPRIKERRRHLVPLLRSQSPAAVNRYDRLVAASGLHRVPVITWSPREAGSDALAYGRPGRYRIAVTPAILGSARRHPDAFDTNIRHELGHVRNHDILITYFAVASWYAMLPVLAVPLFLSLAASDFSQVPEYLTRALVLSAMMYLTRAALLRTREYYADIRADSWSQDADMFSAQVAAAPAQGRSGGVRRWWALHPASGERIRTVRDPSGLGRPRVSELLAISFTAGAALPLFFELVASIPGIALTDADYVARSMGFAILGGFVGAVLVRAVAAGMLAVRMRGALAGVVALGVSTGLLLSLNETGLLHHAGSNAIGNVILSLLCGALVILGADVLLVRASSPGTRPPVVRSIIASLIAAAAFALAADLSLSISAMGSNAARALLDEELPFIFANGSWASTLAVLVTVVAGAGIASRRGSWKKIVFHPVLGCGIGVLAAIGATAIRWHAGVFASDEAAWHYYLASLWIVAAGATVAGLASTFSDRKARGAAGVLTGAFAIVLGCAVFILLNRIAGSPMNVADAAAMARLTSAIAVIIGLPLIALASIATSFFRGARAPAH